MPYNRLGGSLGFLEWNGRFTNDNIAIGKGLVGFTGGQTGGPLIVYDTTNWQPGNGSQLYAKPPSLLIAPLNQVKSSILGIVEDDAHMGSLWRLSGGPQGHITSLDAGYTYSFVVLATPYGITNATYNYGTIMRQYYNTTKLGGNPQDIASSVIDPLTYKVSYWTDNGAYYYAGYWNKYLNSTNTGNTLFPRLFQYHQETQNPVAYGTYQLDPWWYPQTDNGATNWTYDPSIFPDGINPLVALGMQFTLYSSYYSGNITLMNEGMPGYDWRQSEYFNVGWFEGYISLPSVDKTYNFYSDMFARAKAAGWGMTNYEVDFMDFLNLCFTDHNVNATALQVFEEGMAKAALDAGITVQLCMDLPSDVLFSASAPAFTNARASEDDFPTNDGRWDLGVTNILYGSLNLKPFYDDFWTTSFQGPDSPYGTASENFTELSAIISTLSSGPVGISDGIGFTNVSLVNMTCMSDGRILKPSVPAGMIDAYFASKSGVNVPGMGVIWAAPSYVPISNITAFPFVPNSGSVDTPTQYPFMSVLAIDVPTPGFTLYPWDLSPDITTTTAITTIIPSSSTNSTSNRTSTTSFSNVQGYVSVPWSNGMNYITQIACKDSNPACGCVSMFNPMNPLFIQTGTENTDHSKPHELYHLSPLYTSGWAVIGELSKITRVSIQRFAWINGGDKNTTNSLSFAVNGTTNEVVNIALVVPPAADEKEISTCAIPPLVGGMGTMNDQLKSSSIVQGTIKIVTVAFTSVGQQIINCNGKGSSAVCTVNVN